MVTDGDADVSVTMFGEDAGADTSDTSAKTPDNDPGEDITKISPELEKTSDTHKASPVTQLKEAIDKPDEPPIKDEKVDPLDVDKLMAKTKPGATQAKPGSRDYTGFTPEEIAVLKRMPNDAFNFLSKKLKDAKVLEEEVKKVRDVAPKVEYKDVISDPEAYLLDKSYRTAQAEISRISEEADELLALMPQIEAGEDVQYREGYDDQGKPVYSQPTKVDKYRALAAYQTAMSKIAEHKTTLDGIKKSYGESYKQVESYIEQKNKQHFPWEKNVAELERKVSVGGEEKTIKQILEDFKGSMVPPQFRNHPVTRTAANLFVTLQMYAQKIMELSENVTTEQIKAANSRKAEPNTSGVTGAPSGDVVSADMFDD